MLNKHVAGGGASGRILFCSMLGLVSRIITVRKQATSFYCISPINEFSLTLSHFIWITKSTWGKFKSTYTEQTDGDARGAGRGCVYLKKVRRKATRWWWVYCDRQPQHEGGITGTAGGEEEEVEAEDEGGSRSGVLLEERRWEREGGVSGSGFSD